MTGPFIQELPRRRRRRPLNRQVWFLIGVAIIVAAYVLIGLFAGVWP